MDVFIFFLSFCTHVALFPQSKKHWLCFRLCGEFRWVFFGVSLYAPSFVYFSFCVHFPKCNVGHLLADVCVFLSVSVTCSHPENICFFCTPPTSCFHDRKHQFSENFTSKKNQNIVRLRGKLERSDKLASTAEQVSFYFSWWW